MVYSIASNCMTVEELGSKLSEVGADVSTQGMSTILAALTTRRKRLSRLRLRSSVGSSGSITGLHKSIAKPTNESRLTRVIDEEAEWVSHMARSGGAGSMYNMRAGSSETAHGEGRATHESGIEPSDSPTQVSLELHAPSFEKFVAGCDEDVSLIDSSAGLTRSVSREAEVEQFASGDSRMDDAGAPVPLGEDRMTKADGELPVVLRRREIVDAIVANQVLIIVGETGSGKTTKVPQFIVDSPALAERVGALAESLGNLGPSSNCGTTRISRTPRVCVTQPRRVAAISVADRVAKERGVKLGREVGYAVRFDDCSDPDLTKIRFVTDGILIRELLSKSSVEEGRKSSEERHALFPSRGIDPSMMGIDPSRDIDLDSLSLNSDVYILDEVHERSVNTDVLLGVFKKLLAKTVKSALSLPGPTCLEPGKSSLVCGPRLVIMSATLEAAKLSEYFWNCPVLQISGKTYPVDIRYYPEISDGPGATLGTSDYAQSAVECVKSICSSNLENGDVLVFLTGSDEVEQVCESLRRFSGSMNEKTCKPLIVLPMYAGLPRESQELVFRRFPQQRKVIVSTNVAEASITIDGIKYVVDSGKVKLKVYNPKKGMDSLIVTDVSKASAVQRAGRAGRTAPGVCYRIYPECHFDRLRDQTVPEIQRCDLDSVLLNLLAMGIREVGKFGFLSPPSKDGLDKSFRNLFLLGAVSEDGSLTDLGRLMAKFPLSPRESKTLLASVDLEVVNSVCAILAMLSVDNVRMRPRRNTQALPNDPGLGMDGRRGLGSSAEDDVDIYGSRHNSQAQRTQPESTEFNSLYGDHVSLLRIYAKYGTILASSPQQGVLSDWCQRNLLNERSLSKAVRVNDQLHELLSKALRSVGKSRLRGTSSVTSGDQVITKDASRVLGSSSAVASFEKESDNGSYVRVRKAITAGFFFNTAKRLSGFSYAVLMDRLDASLNSKMFNSGQQGSLSRSIRARINTNGSFNRPGVRDRSLDGVLAHPSSVLSRKCTAEYVLFHELIETSAEYMRTVCVIDPAWLPEVAPALFQVTREASKGVDSGPLRGLGAGRPDADAWRLSKRPKYLA